MVPANELHTTNTMNRNTSEFIHRSKILCTLITPKLGTEVFVQVNTGTIYGLVQGIISEFPGGLDGWDYRVRVTDNSSDIRFSIDDVVDVIGRNIFLGQR
jgi:hypothetical protein